MLHLTGIADLAKRYDGFIIDLWGVIHDGITPFSDALECLAHLQGKPTLLLSNAPRRIAASRAALTRLGIADDTYTDIMTSGEAAWCALRDRTDPWFADIGDRLYHIGPDRDRSVFEDLGLKQVSDPESASFVLNTGPDDRRDAQSVNDFVPELEACLNAGLKMVCPNPDLEIVRGGCRVICAGALAADYEARGGKVRYIGKPDPAIYDLVVDRMAIPRAGLLAIGDSLRTDIAGAAAAGIDSLWILGGLHAAEVGDAPDAINAAVAAAGLAPVAAMPRLAW